MIVMGTKMKKPNAPQDHNVKRGNVVNPVVLVNSSVLKVFYVDKVGVSKILVIKMNVIKRAGFAKVVNVSIPV